jgi:hypothetical protein
MTANACQAPFFKILIARDAGREAQHVSSPFFTKSGKLEL